MDSMLGGQITEIRSRLAALESDRAMTAERLAALAVSTNGTRDVISALERKVAAAMNGGSFSVATTVVTERDAMGAIVSTQKAE